MIQDVLVSVETAKALKAAGYPQASAIRYYNCEEDKVSTYAPICVASGSDVLDAETCEQYRANYIAVPLYSEALQWLDGRGVYVRIVPPCGGVHKWESMAYYANGYDLIINCTSRVEAADAAIMNAANELIKK